MGGLVAQSETLAETVAPMIQMINKMSGYIMEVHGEVAVERGQINSLPGFVLPRLGNTSGGSCRSRWRSIGNTAERCCGS